MALRAGVMQSDRRFEHLACDFTKRRSDGTASAPLPRRESHPEPSAFIGVYRRPIKNVLALAILPTKIY
jgi:hypothetical protein